MFKWIKVVSQLSRQDDVMAALETRVAGVTSQIEIFTTEAARTLEGLKTAKNEADSAVERLNKIVDEVEKILEETARKVATEKSDLAKIGKELEGYQDAIGKKVDELQKSAQEHLEAVNEKVLAYDSSVSELGKEIMRLGDSIAEFQKR